jgi:ATP-binding cassette, subfamily B, bacterial PglK
MTDLCTTEVGSATNWTHAGTSWKGVPMPAGPPTPLRTILASLPASVRRKALATMPLLVLGALVEVISLGAVLPFLTILTGLQRAPEMPMVKSLIARLPPAIDLLGAATAVFLGLLLISGALRLYLTWRSFALVQSMSFELTVAAFRKLIRQPYPFYLTYKSSVAQARFDMIHAITYTVLQAGVQALAATLLAVLLMIAMLIIDPLIAVLSAGVMIGAYLATSLAVQPVLDRNSKVFATAWDRRIRGIQQALGGIRDILIDRSQAAFEADFTDSADRLRRALTQTSYISYFPRVLVEIVALMLIAVLVWYLARGEEGLLAAIPKLGALAACGQRLLPLLQAAYLGWSQIRGSRESIGEVAQLLELPDTGALPQGRAVAPLRFSQSVELDAVEFRFATGGPILDHIDLSIAKGERVGIAGPTGAGKTTLMDVLLGLLEPVSGCVRVDGVPLHPGNLPAWHRNVAHVPQDIFIADDTIAANIAFGTPEDAIDHTRVERAARNAGIHQFISQLANRYGTQCGERGVRLSGGQRQRIGIARALYKRASFLVLDEATSALDNETEREVMAAIAQLSREITVVMVAHRLSTLANCDRIVHMRDGRIDWIEAPPTSAGSA